MGTIVLTWIFLHTIIVYLVMVGHSEKCFFSDTHEGGGAGQDKDSEASEDVDGKEGGSEV